MIRGEIFNIQKFSIQDGPGIRTTVFFRGCPLRCKWCANPESQDRYRGLSAEEFSAREADVDEVLRIVLQDKPFYEESGGGMTMSGGEPLRQADFAEALAKAAHESGVHVAMETTGFAAPEDFERVAAQVDLLLFDVKHYDPEKHREGTGVDCERIHANLRSAQAAGKEIVARIPVIPGFNARLTDAAGLAELIAGVGIGRVDLLPFHQLGEHKYEKLGVDYAMAGMRPLPPEALGKYREEFLRRGLDCRIG